MPQIAREIICLAKKNSRVFARKSIIFHGQKMAIKTLKKSLVGKLKCLSKW